MAYEHVKLTEAEIAEIDALPNPGPPKPGVPALSLIALQLIAEFATRAGLSILDVGREEDVLAAVSNAADAVLPLNSSDASPGAWARRGAYAGIVDAWRANEYSPPAGLEVGDLELYQFAWASACTVVFRVRATEGGR